MKIFYKFILFISLLIFLFWWIVLSPVSFPDENESYYSYSVDKKWKLMVSPISMTTPLSLIQGLEGKRYIILFDKDGNYVGQSTPFCFMWLDDYDVIFPSKLNKDLLFMPENCNYTIPIGEKRWWSKIIDFINY